MKKEENDMAIGNPARCWISGSDTETFQYRHGKEPWICQYWSDSWVAMTAMVFADDEAHARKIIADMLEWAEEHLMGEYKCCSHNETLQRLIRVKAMKLNVCKADKSQIYKVGWASNDTFGFC